MKQERQACTAGVPRMSSPDDGAPTGLPIRIRADLGPVGGARRSIHVGTEHLTARLEFRDDVKAGINQLPCVSRGRRVAHLDGF